MFVFFESRLEHAAKIVGAACSGPSVGARAAIRVPHMLRFGTSGGDLLRNSANRTRRVGSKTTLRRFQSSIAQIRVSLVLHAATSSLVIVMLPKRRFCKAEQTFQRYLLAVCEGVACLRLITHHSAIMSDEAEACDLFVKYWSDGYKQIACA